MELIARRRGRRLGGVAIDFSSFLSSDSSLHLWHARAPLAVTDAACTSLLQTPAVQQNGCSSQLPLCYLLHAQALLRPYPCDGLGKDRSELKSRRESDTTRVHPTPVPVVIQGVSARVVAE